jgi:tripartite-type tricarboxylate transporter receptor subunit TctC
MQNLLVNFVKAAFATLSICAVCAYAQDYPNHPVSVVVAYPPGGAVDAVGRTLAEHLGQSLGKTFVVDNRAGASGNIGAQYVARARADGYTLLMAPVTTYAMNLALYPDVVGYQLVQDFTPVSIVGSLPLVMVVSDAVKAKTASQLVSMAKASPASLNFASSGNGSIEHVAGELFKQQESVHLLHIPYKGAAPAMTDVMSNQVQIMFATAPTALIAVKTGKVRALLVATPKRLANFPDVPTARESGLPGFEVASTYAILAPAKTPPAIVQKLNEEIVKIMSTAEVRERFTALGIEAVSSTPEQARQTVATEVARWSQVIHNAGIKAE